ncbi:MAG: hypothetical protein L3J83_07835, partial [Proteobacteria bacterium]|nr:hypothetical protein [Pseudomonadota bacterium]
MIDIPKIDPVNLKLFSKFKEILSSLEQLNDTPQTSSESDEMLAKAVAFFCLESNIKAEKFNVLFRYQLVDILKKTNPEMPNVDIAVRTGINRRYIGTIDKSVKQSKEMLILSYLKSYCEAHKTTHIKKKGPYNSFAYFCTLGANGTLTANSISKELLRLG